MSTLPTFSGLTPSSLARRYGTPLYAYDGDVIEDRFRQLESAFAGVSARIHYSVKALATGRVLELVRELGGRLDVVSVYEARMGLAAGFRPEEILFTTSHPSIDEILEAVDIGIGTVLGDLESVELYADRVGGRVPIGIRLRPDLSGDGMPDAARAWSADTLFGIPDRDLEEVVEMVAGGRLRVDGIHIHTGSALQGEAVFHAAARCLLEAASRFERIRYLDLGGGFRPDSDPRGPGPDLFSLGAWLAGELEQFYPEAKSRPEILLEPGRFLVAEAGCLVTRVTGIEERTGAERIACVDTGFHQFIRPRLYGAQHEVVNLSNPDGTPMRTRIFGCLCEADEMAKEDALPEVRTGDLLAFTSAGAYGACMASNYNGRPRPVEVLVRGGVARLARRRETMADILGPQL